MTVHIDGIVFSLQAQGGISVYFREMLSRLDRSGLPALLSLESPARQQLPAYGAQLKVDTRSARTLERYRDAREMAGQQRPGVFHSSYYRRPALRSAPTVVTVHDFAYERCQRGPTRWVHSAQKFAAIRQAQAIICISQATRDDLLELVGLRADQQLHVIYNGVSEQFYPLAAPSAVPGSRPFILFVGQRGRYKNFRLVAQALAHLPTDIELHCVGGGPIGPGELQDLPEATRRRIRHLGLVDDTRLNQCYNTALCLAYVSAYEGFGIPVIEAMRAGCPVVCTPCKAVLEVGQDGLRVSDADPAAVAEAILACADANSRATQIQRGQEIAARYHWQDTFEQTLTIYRRLLG